MWDGSEKDIGIPLAYLKYLEQNDPQLWEYIQQRPEAAFSEGFVAWQKQKTKLMRPVLLLGHYELEWTLANTLTQ